tara:strand:- start:7931 stop:8494 length:564 start_codon:yes stop_codon:yes gene_type:complete
MNTLTNHQLKYKQYIQNEMKPLIDIEMEHVESLERHSRLLCYAIIQHDPNINLNMNFLEKSAREMYEVYKNSSVEKAQNMKGGYDMSIKHSNLKQKFLRYAYNMNYKKAQEAHDKLSEKQLEMCEEMSEADQDGNPFVYSCRQYGINNGEKDTIHTNGGSHFAYSKEMKVSYDWRVKLLKSLKSWNE